MTTKQTPASQPGDSELKIATLAHTAPFLAWIAVMLLATMAQPAAWHYLVRAALSGSLLLVLQPWRWYARLQLRHLPAALALGTGVFLVWILPEIPFGSEGSYGFAQEFYLRFAVLPLGSLPEGQVPSLYDPRICGWPLSLLRLAGSAFVIAIVEEFFWRGFLYRWLLGRPFLSSALDEFQWDAFLKMVVLFGLEHDRWLVGMIAGAAYGWLLLRTRDIWAVALSHAATNLLLGIYVLNYRAFAFW